MNNNSKKNKPANAYKCGYISIVGRANVGKSTLLNHLIGEKISITTRKPQTTRWQLSGILSQDDAQIIFIDTPGLQQTPQNGVHRYMNREVINAINQVEVVLFVVQALFWTEEDEHVLKALQNHKKVILLVNKTDKVNDKARLLPFIKKISAQHEFLQVLTISAKQGDGMEQLVNLLIPELPNAPALYEKDEITDKSIRFLVAELIREQLFKRLGQELPYHITVTIEKFKETSQRVDINALIWVEKPGQKTIVIGKGGEGLKQVGQQARKNISELLQKHVRLETWVKVKKNWSNDEKMLKQLGYTNKS